MDSLLEKCSKIITKSAENGDCFIALGKNKKVELLNLIDNILVHANKKEFNSFFELLMELKKEVVCIYPEEFHPTFVDFISDQNMWDWIESKENNNDAINYIVNDLIERKENKEILNNC